MSFHNRLLENQLAHSIEEDRIKSNINSTKLNAMSSSANYEDFKNRVSVANLKPIDNKNGLQFVKNRSNLKDNNIYQSNIPIVSNAEKDALLLLSDLKIETYNIPKNITEFERIFKKLNNNSIEKLKYLSIIPITSSIFKYVDFDILISCLSCLSNIQFNRSDCNTAYTILKLLKESSRFIFLYSSLPAINKAQTNDIFEKLIASLIDLKDDSDVKLIYNNDDLLELKKSYT